MSTLLDKIWTSHIVRETEREPTLIYIDLHLVHEVTSPQAFAGLRQAGRKVRRPDLTVATVDHNVPTTDRSLPIADATAATQVDTLRKNCSEFGIQFFDINSPRTRDRSCYWTRTRLDAGRDLRSSVATVTRALTEHLVLWRLVSALVKLSMY
jgi:hypothetical protein